MWNSDWCWNTSGEINKELRPLKLNKEKESVRNENNKKHYKALD